MRKALLICLLLAVEAFAQQRATVYELGPEVFSTHARANGYQWRAWGYVYPRGTQARLGGPCQWDDRIAPLGVYVVHGTTGGPGQHLATYRVSIGQQNLYFNGEVQAADEEGFPLSSLFDLTGAGDGAKAELTPRSTDCFGGELKIFAGE